jgi:NAD(P)-dependent dehydrogenase (short-subunit alcohol dehydrogenase family)
LPAADGYDVAVNYVRDKAAADTVVADIEKAGRRAVSIQADVSREQDVERLFATIDEKLGRLTHLVFNSGVTGPMSRIMRSPPTPPARFSTSMCSAPSCAHGPPLRGCRRRRAGQGAPSC